MEKQWKFLSADENTVKALQAELNIHPAICKILVQRGIHTYQQARDYFRPLLEQLHNPFLMQDMDKAINRITQAIATGEHIMVYGDYDVDGTTAIATVFSFFSEYTQRIMYYTPNRYTEGYGISSKGIAEAARLGVSLIIALDCGIKSVDKVAEAATLGIDFIICDHHLPGHEIPAAVAVLDPKRDTCAYPYKELSGCGIGFKLIQAYAQQHSLPEQTYLRYLDLVCVSIGADIVPITGENRILAYHGLQKINSEPGPGLAKLLEVSGITRKLTITDVVFILAPRINAAGRMEDASHAVKLLISAEAATDIVQHAAKLHDLNADRKDLDRDITRHALEMLETLPNLATKKSTVVYHPEWNKGVIGIVASRLTETYYRPTVVLTHSDGKVTGSARSVKYFNLYEALYECRDLLLQFGGHQFAAGLTMLPENVEAFTARFEEVVSSSITDEQLIPEIEIDAVIQLADIKQSFYNIIEQMGPFGPQNMRPVFATTALTDTGWSRVVKEQHLKFSVRDNTNTRMDGIGFGLADKYPLLKQGPFDLVYQIEENEWNGSTTLQLMVKDVR